MSKAIKITIVSFLIMIVVGLTAYGSYVALNTDKSDDLKTKTSVDLNEGPESSGRNLVYFKLKNDGLEFDYYDPIKIISSIETNDYQEAEVPRGDNVEMESGSLRLSVFSAAYGIGGDISCLSPEFKCEAVSSKNISVFGEDMKMTLWREPINMEGSNSESVSYRIVIGNKGTKEDIGLFTYSFESKNLKNSKGEPMINGLSISKSDGGSITEEDFNSEDMNNLVDVIKSIRY